MNKDFLKSFTDKSTENYVSMLMLLIHGEVATELGIERIRMIISSIKLIGIIESCDMDTDLKELSLYLEQIRKFTDGISELSHLIDKDKQLANG